MRILVLLFSLIPCLVFAQIDIDFESGELDRWIMPDESRWGLDDINPISGNYTLKHIYDNSESGVDVASFPISGLSVEDAPVRWSFRIRHAYNPSSSNNWAVILSSDQELNPGIEGGTMNGPVLGINLTGYDDTLRLWNIKNGHSEIIVNTLINWQTDIGTQESPLLIVEREPNGYWRVLVHPSGGDPYLVGTGEDKTLFATEFFGICYSYTSSCDQLFWIDDIAISGVFEEDIDPPEVSGTRYISNQTLRLSFDESINTEGLSANNFILKPNEIRPDEIAAKDPGTIDLLFNEGFRNKTSYELDVTNVCDMHGNCLDTLIEDLSFVYPEWGDLVITEIMADPEPAVDLPGIEYFEIYNSSDFTINLNSLSFQSGNDVVLFPGYLLDPKTYIAVCDENDTSLLSEECDVIGLRSMPVLNNSSDYLLLIDSLSGTIHGVKYENSWQNNQFKDNGGWSFEMIDPDYPFAGPENWTYSADLKGGTPGYQNSVYQRFPDLIEPVVRNCFPVSPVLVTLDFSEPVTNVCLFNSSLHITGAVINNVKMLDSLRNSYCVSLESELSGGVLYTIDFQDISDYGGNNLYPLYYRFGLPQKPMPQDVIINEIMFEPMSGEPEYIEFYNRSDRIVDVGSMLITTINLQSGDSGIISYLSDEPRCLLPGEYFAITENKDAVLSHYFESDPLRVFEVNNLPSLPDNEGRVLVLYKDLTVIDDFTYYDDFHMDLISGTAGVSLERVNPDISTSSKYNWHSATSLSGWGTPGSRNSVYMQSELLQESSLTLSSSRISPDNDGYEDILAITLNMGEGEWIVDIIIYDDMGFRVNKLFENMTTSGTESVFWDGNDQYGRLLSGGIYIIFVRAVSVSGEIKKWKKVCSVLRR